MNTTINTVDTGNLQVMFNDYMLETVTSPICHDDIKIMVYPNRNDFKYGGLFKVQAIIEYIRSNSDFENVISKDDLHVCYFSVGGFNGRKEDYNVIYHTKLIIIDIDKKDNPDLDFDNLKQQLSGNKYVFAFFTSPSGGLKVVFNTNIQNKEHHKAYYQHVKDYVLKTYPEIIEIDTSGINIARACYLPHDSNAYYNPCAYRICLKEADIASKVEHLRVLRTKSKLEYQYGSLSFDEHYENMLDLIKKRTSVGLYIFESQRESIFPINNDLQKGTQVPLAMSNSHEKGTQVPLQMSNSPEKRTQVGLYDNVFNNYRFSSINCVMITDVPFLDILILKNMYPYRLDWKTRIDECYFKDNPDKPISAVDIGIDGLDFCELGLDKNTVIKEHYRAKTLGSISMRLIFNNPFCHPQILYEAMLQINGIYCEDPDPIGNPRPDDEEVWDIVMHNYSKFLDGTLDFSRVIRKNRHGAISKKYVFRSRLYEKKDQRELKLEGIRTFSAGKKSLTMKKYAEAVSALMDGTKITSKRIAEYIHMSPRNLRRYDTVEYIELIKRYNNALIGNDKRKVTCRIKNEPVIDENRRKIKEAIDIQQMKDDKITQEMVNKLDQDNPAVPIESLGLDSVSTDIDNVQSIYDLDTDFDDDFEEIVPLVVEAVKAISAEQIQNAFNMVYAQHFQYFDCAQLEILFLRFTDLFNQLPDDDARLLIMPLEDVANDKFFLHSALVSRCWMLCERIGEIVAAEMDDR